VFNPKEATRKEDCSLKLQILSSMACGTPILATIVGLIPDILIDGET
jgi:glycosyltransferase involved in cell wall biosynthesis